MPYQMLSARGGTISHVICQRLYCIICHLQEGILSAVFDIIWYYNVCHWLEEIHPQWGAVDAEIKVLSAENTELKGAPCKSLVGQYIAIHATLTARDFFLANFYPSGPFTSIFFQNLSRVFLVLALANTGSCVGPQNKIGQPAWCRFLCRVPAEYK